MNRQSLRHLATAGALASLLTLTAPAQAAGWSLQLPEGGFFQAAWHWVESLWEPGSDLVQEKAGIEIDPNVQPNTVATPCPVNCDRGSGIDPNG